MVRLHRLTMTGTYNGMRQAQGSVARGVSLTSYVYGDYAHHTPATHSPPEQWKSPGNVTWTAEDSQRVADLTAWARALAHVSIPRVFWVTAQPSAHTRSQALAHHREAQSSRDRDSISKLTRLRSDLAAAPRTAWATCLGGRTGWMIPSVGSRH